MADISIYKHHLECILKVLVHIEEHLEEPLELERMAQIAHISPYHFHRLFRAYVGETLASHVKRLRLARAAEKLKYTDVSVTDIAFDVGYETSASFSKVFHQIIGMSPSQYRKKMHSLIRVIIKRIQPKDKIMIKPQYISRKDESILFIRRVGDYKETPSLAFEVLIHFLEIEGKTKHHINAFYAIAMDDPNIVEHAKCRFDACVALNDKTSPRGEVGQKVLPGGRYAVFAHRGPYEDLEKTFDEIFSSWYPSTKEQIRDYPPFCELINPGDKSTLDKDRQAKIFIPLQ